MLTSDKTCLQEKGKKPISTKRALQAHGLKALALCIGIIFFCITVSKFGGFKGILRYSLAIYVGLPLALLTTFVGILFFTKAWQQYFPIDDRQHHFVSLLKVRLCGEAINFMTPLGFVAGDSVRVILIKKYLGPQSHLRSVVIDRVMHFLAAHFVCVVGFMILLVQPIDFPKWLAVSLFLFYVITTLLIMELIVDLVMAKGFGFFDFIFKWVRLERFFPKIFGRLLELREDFSYYKNKPKGPLWYSFFLHLAGRILGVAEIMVIVFAVNGYFYFQFSMALGALTSFFGAGFGFIPGALGVLEMLYAQFFLLHGFTPEMGIAIQLVRRLRVVFWMIVGGILLDYNHVARFFRKKETPHS